MECQRPSDEEVAWGPREERIWGAKMQLLRNLEGYLHEMKYSRIYSRVKVQRRGYTGLKSVSHSCPTLCYPMNCSPQGFSSHGFLQQEYWNGWPFPSPGDLPNPGIKPWYPAFQADSLPSERPGKLHIYVNIFMDIYSPSLKYFSYLFKNPHTRETNL